MAHALKAKARCPASRLQCRARRLLTAGLLALAAHGPGHAQLTQSELDHLFGSIRSLQASQVLIAPQDWARCVATLDETAALAQRGWTQTNIDWFGLRMRCEARLLQSRGQAVTAQTIADLAGPGLKHFARVPPGVARRTGARMLLLQNKWWLMRDLGLGDVAALEERQLVQALLEADRVGPDAAAREDLDRWAHSMYGQHALLRQIEADLAWIGATWGAGHRAALILRRAISFAYRSADRSAEALVVMDEAVRLAGLHHPADKELQLMLAGERAPCLAANGLWLEARDEFTTLRDGMLRQQPVPHGNLMRMNYHLAAIASTLGDYEQAEAFAEAAHWHAQQSTLPNDRVEVAVAHLQRAEARLLRGLPDAVAEVRREVERVGAADGGTGAPAFSLAKLAHRNGDTALLDWARDFLDRHARERLQPLQPARGLVEITAAWSIGEREPVRARELLERAATRGLSDRDPGVSVQSAFSLARALSDDQPEAALWWYKRGANALQAMRQRGRVAQDDSMHRATLADHEADLRNFIALLIDEGRYLEARDALRVLREEELHDFTRRSRHRAAAARAGGLAFTAQELRFERTLEPLAARMRNEQLQADARAQPAPLEGRSMGWLDDPATEHLLAQLQRDLHAVLAEAGAAGQPGGIESACPRPPAATSRTHCRPAPWRDESPMQALPSPGTAQLRIFVRDQHLDVLVTTARGWFRHRAPITRTELNRRVHGWRTALLDPTADAHRGAREFHDLLIKPVQSQLRGVQTLRVSLDGALRYLPVAALHDGDRYLVQRFSVLMDDGIGAGTTMPPAVTEPVRDGATPLRLAAFGRVAPDREHTALPGVRAELQVLSSLNRGRHPSQTTDRVFEDQAFTAQALHDTLAQAPRLVHIASHFHLAAAEEESSYLLLGDGQRLPLARMAQMPWHHVHLVLLSACDSAVGDAPQPGREFNGLAGVLRQAGARNVLASLWPIADASTASFMREFYRPMIKPKLPDARSTGGGRAGPSGPLPDVKWLTQAQRRWLIRHAGSSLAHPYHWAAFSWWSGAGGSGPGAVASAPKSKALVAAHQLH